MHSASPLVVERLPSIYRRSPFRVYNGTTGNGVIYDSNFLSISSPEVREDLMGFRVGEADIPRLSTSQRFQLLGKSRDLNSIIWAIATIRAHTTSLDPASQGPIQSTTARGEVDSHPPKPSPPCRKSPTSRMGGQLGPLGHRTSLLIHASGPPNISPKT